MTCSPAAVTPALWRWAFGAWVADTPVSEIAASLGLTPRQVYDHATRQHWPRRANNGLERYRPSRWRCECGMLVVVASVCPRGHAAPWKSMEDEGLFTRTEVSHG